jgi:serine phosphatase RsbU (regulator of sigma subunit)
VGLAAGLAALLVTAIAVLTAGGPPPADPDAEFREVGVHAVKTLAAADPAWFAGGAAPGGTDPVKQARKVVVSLFGEKGGEWWDETREATVKPDYARMDPEEQEEAKKARERFLEAEEKMTKGSGGSETGSSRAGEDALRHLAGSAPSDRYRILAAWVRERTTSHDAEGPFVASSTAEQGIYYDYASRTRHGSFAWANGQLGASERTPVRVFMAPMTARGSGKAYGAYVALWRDPAVAGGGGGKGSGMLGIVLIILAPFVVGGLAFAVAGGHAKGIRDLARELDRLGSSGDPNRAIRAHGAEATAVARAVERMVGNLEFRQKHGSADLEEVVAKERRIAEEIHGALMAKNPPRLSDYEVETLFKPGFEIAGDHFEYFRIDEDHLGVVLLDTNVRGIPAALLTSATKAYLRAAAPRELSPAEVLRVVNRNLAGDVPPGRHVTALYVVIDTREGKATVASAGHLPLLVYRHATGKAAKVNPEGIALGLDVGPVFDRALQEGEIPLGIGDRLVLYTDGALQVQNETGEEFGESRFYAAVAREAPKNSQAFVNFVGSAIDQFHLTTPQNDDITISTIKRLK